MLARFFFTLVTILLFSVSGRSWATDIKVENIYTNTDSACYTLVVAIGAPVSLVTATRSQQNYGCKVLAGNGAS